MLHYLAARNGDRYAASMTVKLFIDARMFGPDELHRRVREAADRVADDVNLTFTANNEIVTVAADWPLANGQSETFNAGGEKARRLRDVIRAELGCVVLIGHVASLPVQRLET